MPPASFVKPSTPVSTLSSLGTNATNTATGTVQSGPYTKAQFLNTMEGSRSVKNIKEVEQLLRDYPAALDLYRTGKYKVKVKYEADIERVILVEKRSSKNATTNLTKTNEVQQNKQSMANVSTNMDKMKDVKQEKQSEQTRSRTHSRDRVAPTTTVTDNNPSVQTTSAIRMQSNVQPKVDDHRTTSKEHDVSMASQPKQQPQQEQQQEQQQSTHRRSHSRDDSSNVSHSKQKGKKNSHDFSKTIVPYVPNANQAANMWQQSQALQPYFSNPVLPQYPHMSNIYMPSTFVPQQNSLYQQPYYYGQQVPPAVVYPKQSTYPASSKIKSAVNVTNPILNSQHNYPSSSQTMYNLNHGGTLPSSIHAFQSNQQQYPQLPGMYQSQIPYQMPFPWPTMVNRPVGPLMNNNAHVESRRGSKHRAHSVDTGHRAHPPVHYYNHQQQQQLPPAPLVTEHHHHHHRHHHYQSQPTNVQATNTGTSVETGREQNAPLKETVTAVNNATNGDKLTIRQLNEIFLQTDPSGRLPYSSLPNILQRFGISLTEDNISSAAQELHYNVTEPVSARRLVHILIKLGKIAKSTQQQQQPRPPGSPSMLPEDREVIDIMTHPRSAAVVSTHIHSSIYPNRWY